AMLALALLAPLAFSMGMPFPLGLQRVADRRPDWIPWCWGVNGFLSVIGAAAAPLVALAVGFRGVLLLSAAIYVLAGWILSRISTRAD
ncbi:MAG: SAM-dependent methyltransferase, partial [Gemmatimonadota bacterium]